MSDRIRKDVGSRISFAGSTRLLMGGAMRRSRTLLARADGVQTTWQRILAQVGAWYVVAMLVVLASVATVGAWAFVSVWYFVIFFFFGILVFPWRMHKRQKRTARNVRKLQRQIDAMQAEQKAQTS